MFGPNHCLIVSDNMIWKTRNRDILVACKNSSLTLCTVDYSIYGMVDEHDHILA